MAFLNTICPQCHGPALKNENIVPVIITCLQCGDMRDDGKLLKEIVYSTAWWNEQGVKTQQQVREEKHE